MARVKTEGKWIKWEEIERRIDKVEELKDKENRVETGIEGIERDEKENFRKAKK